MKTPTVLLSIALVVAVGFGVYELDQNSSLKARQDSLSSQIEALNAKVGQLKPPAQNSPDMVMNEKIIRQYYAAYEKKDWHMLEQILADGFTFTSPVDDHIGLKQYKERCWPNAANTKKFDLEQVMVAGDDAFVTYNGWTNDGRLFRNTERFKLKDGKIVANECFFGSGVNFPNNQAGK